MNAIKPRPYSKDYEITDAMFGAFRAPGGARFFSSLLGWTTALLSVIFLVALPPIVRAYLGVVGSIVGLDDADPIKPGELERAMGGLGDSLLAMTPALVLLGVGTLAVTAVVRAAFYRRYFHGWDGGWFPFRLGGDEWRQFVVQLGYWGLFVLVYVLFVFLTAVLSGALAGGAAAVGADGAVLAITILLVAAIYIGMFVVGFWYGITFAPAGALTGLRRRTHLLAARRVTKNRYWALFGSILVAGLLGYTTYYALSLTGISAGLSSLLTGEMMEGLLSGEDPSAALGSLRDTAGTTRFRIGAFFAVVMTAAGNAFYILMLLGPSAFFVRQWEESDPTAVFH